MTHFRSRRGPCCAGECGVAAVSGVLAVLAQGLPQPALRPPTSSRRPPWRVPCGGRTPSPERLAGGRLEKLSLQPEGDRVAGAKCLEVTSPVFGRAAALQAPQVCTSRPRAPDRVRGSGHDRESRTPSQPLLTEGLRPGVLHGRQAPKVRGPHTHSRLRHL